MKKRLQKDTYQQKSLYKIPLTMNNIKYHQVLAKSHITQHKNTNNQVLYYTKLGLIVIQIFELLRTY